MDAPENPIKLPKNKNVLIFGGVAGAAVLYWWWHRAPAVATPDTTLTPSTDPNVRDPGPGASGDVTGTAPAGPVAPVDDTAWAQLALSTMTARGFEPTLVSDITNHWLSSEPITTAKEIALVAVMLPIVGYPPSGLHPILGNTAPSPAPTPTPPPPSAWTGPLVRKAKGGATLTVRVPFTSAWEWWVMHEYTNIPPDAARRTAAAKALHKVNEDKRGRAYHWDTVSPPQVIDIPAALYV